MSEVTISEDELKNLKGTLKSLQERNQSLEKALEKLVNLYVANRGSEGNEFISCVTVGHPVTALERRKCKYWSAWDAARILLGD